MTGGIGRTIVQTPSSALTAYAGLAVNRELTNSDGGQEQTVEGVLGVDWRVFRFHDPETSLTSSVVAYPSITESTRYRSTVDVTLRHEMIEDLFLDLSVYGAYDSRPPSDDSDQSDYGIVTSVGYSF